MSNADAILARLRGTSAAQATAAPAPAAQGAPAATDIDALIAKTGGKVSKEEFARLPADIQSAILADPETFLRGQRGETYSINQSPYELERVIGAKYVDAQGNAIENNDTAYVDDFGKIRNGDAEVFNNPNFGNKQYLKDQIAANPLTKAGLDPYQWSAYTTNGANGDMLSVGAEGGVSGYQNLKWVPGVGLVRPNSDFMAVQDNGADIAGSLALGVLTAGFGSALSAVGATGIMGSGYSLGTVADATANGAILGGARSAATDGDIGKGMLLGAAGGALGGYASGLKGTTAGIADKTLATIGGKAAIAAASGKSPAEVAAGVAGGAAGAATADLTGNNFASGLASTLTSRFVGAALADDPSAATQSPTNTNPATPQITSLPKVPGLVGMMRR